MIADWRRKLRQRLRRFNMAMRHFFAHHLVAPHCDEELEPRRDVGVHLPNDFHDEIHRCSRRKSQIPEPGLLRQSAQALLPRLCTERQADLLGE
jgi:hypothetical protein